MGDRTYEAGEFRVTLSGHLMHITATVTKDEVSRLIDRIGALQEILDDHPKERDHD